MPAAVQANAFYREVAKTNCVWMIGGPEGGAKTIKSGTKRVMPLWSSRRRVEKIISTVEGYADGTVLSTSWDDFEENWIPVILKQGVLVGINWSGPNANGYEMPIGLLQSAIGMVKSDGA